MSKFYSLSLSKKHLELNKKVFNYIWLRDHCACNICYNPIDKQKIFDITRVSLDISPEKCELDSKDFLHITWSDGHMSSYDVKPLMELKFGTGNGKWNRDVELWDKQSVQSMVKSATYNLDELKLDKSVLKELFRSVLTYGFAFVNGAEPSKAGVKEVATTISLILNSFFGDVWDIRNDIKEFNDAGHNSKELEFHNDNACFTEASGLMVLQVVYHDGVGGNTCLVDGYKVVEDLKKKDLKSFNFLTENAIISEYIDVGADCVSKDYVIKLDPITKAVQQIRYNNYDRATLTTFAQEDVEQFYVAYKKLADEIYNPENEWRFKLEPGTCLIMDNFRLLHRRTEFTGKRVLTGSYIGRGPWISQAKLMGLIID